MTLQQSNSRQLSTIENTSSSVMSLDFITSTADTCSLLDADPTLSTQKVNFEENDEVSIHDNDPFTITESIENRIRLPIHPSACIVCRRCLICSHKHGQSVCFCASLGTDIPKKGFKLPSFMTDSRKIVFDFECPILRNFTIDWVKKNADEMYQPLFYIHAVPSGYVSVCSAHSSKYFSDCRGAFLDAKNSKRLLPGSIEYDIYEAERKIIPYPKNIFKYLTDRSAGWNLTKTDTFKKQNKVGFHLLCLDTCESIHVGENKINAAFVEINDMNTSKLQKKKENERREIVKRKTSNASEKAQKKAKVFESGEHNDTLLSSEQSKNLLSVSIWNAPSMETYNLSRFRDDSELTILYYLPEFIAADCLIVKNIIIEKNQLVSSLLEHVQLQLDSSIQLSPGVQFRCVKDWKIKIDINNNFDQFLNYKVFRENHLDLYIGTYSQK